MDAQELECVFRLAGNESGLLFQFTEDDTVNWSIDEIEVRNGFIILKSSRD